jgi:uncharacterized membrane-anchored protein YjiN (DUF445 family)
LKKKIGQISLFIAIAGLLITEVGIYLGVLQHQFWNILLTGFEAATIGALADWFAVSALFHEIPIPLIGRHTNIIVKNRQKLTEAIVELVTTKWLSSEIIKEKLEGIPIAAGTFKVLEKSENLARVIDFSRSLLHRFSDNLDNPEVAQLVQKLLKDQLEDMDIATPLGNWLQEIVLEKDHHQMVNRLLGESAVVLEDPTTRLMIQGKLIWALESYENKDWIKKSLIWIGKKTGGIDLGLLTDHLLDLTKVLAMEARADPAHPLRQKLDQSLLEFAQNLQAGDPSYLTFINNIKKKLIEGDQAKSMIWEFLSRFKTTVADQLKSNDTTFMMLFKDNVGRLLKELKADKAAQLKIDEWVKETIAHLINKYHHEVGNMVRTSLLKLDDKELVSQIQDKVGDDLQYIRLNGAVVGGLVGILIAVVRNLFLQ